MREVHKQPDLSKSTIKTKKSQNQSDDWINQADQSRIGPNFLNQKIKFLWELAEIIPSPG